MNKFASFSLIAALSQPLLAQEEFRTYVDLHCQPSLKAFNSRSTNIGYGVWAEINHTCSNERAVDVMASTNSPKFSQSHFEALIQGNVRLISLTISPVEQQFINSSTYLNDRNKKATLACLYGINANELFARRKEIDYFQDAMEHIDYLKRNENKPYYYNGHEYKYMIIRTVADIDTVLNNPHRIGIVLNIEGGHALGHSIYMNDKITDRKDYEELVFENINRLKNQLPIRNFSDDYLDVPILYIGLAKTFPNGLGGTSLSMGRAQQTIFGRPEEIGSSNTPLGLKVIELISNASGNSRPVLIDVKHMSLEFRKTLYEELDRMQLMGNVPPVIASHVGISGLPWKSNIYKKKDDELKNGNEYLCHWQQNLSEEDIKRIGRQNGIIALTLDKTVLGGDLALRRIAEAFDHTQQKRDACLELFLANVLKAVQVLASDIKQDSEKSRAWNYLAIGSDFDGMREPLDVYASAADIPTLHSDIQRFFENPRAIAAEATGLDEKTIKGLMFGLSSSEIADRIMWKNGVSFLRARIAEQSFPERAKTN